MNITNKEWLVVSEFKNGNFIVIGVDSKVEADKGRTAIAHDGFEVGNPISIKVGENLDYVCPVCDGGPGNYCSCKCPDKRG